MKKPFKIEIENNTYVLDKIFCSKIGGCIVSCEAIEECRRESLFDIECLKSENNNLCYRKESMNL